MAWETGSGLLDEYEGTIEEAWFDTHLDYNDGESLLLHWLITDITDPEGGPGPDEITERFSLGAGWAAVDNNQRAEKEYGKEKFNRTSKYGVIIDRVVGAVPEFEEAFEGAKEVVTSRGDEKDAKVWEGLRFRFRRELVDFGFGERETLLPVEFVGVAEEVTPSTSSSNGSSEASRDDLEDQLTELAQDASDHKEFMSEAADIDAVRNDDELFLQVADESDEGFYAQATA